MLMCSNLWFGKAFISVNKGPSKVCLKAYYKFTTKEVCRYMILFIYSFIQSNISKKECHLTIRYYQF